MEMKKCPHCKEEIKKEAAQCPYCGGSIPWKDPILILLVIVIVFLYIAALF